MGGKIIFKCISWTQSTGGIHKSTDNVTPNLLDILFIQSSIPQSMLQLKASLNIYDCCLFY